jgi:2-hydroxy-6-oxonona-2,4-dienedioate hydrolase
MREPRAFHARLAGVGLGVVVALAATAAWTASRFHVDLQRARTHSAQGSTLIDTRCGPIEVQQAGAGVPLLVVHGSGGGRDQGMAFAGTLAAQGIRVIAMSRFGYLRTPMPADASAAAQADAHVCLLDALGIRRAAVMGGSAGAPSALQMALRHPDRVTALILLVPLAYKPPTQADSAAPMPAWVEATMMRWLGSDFLFWAAIHGARDSVIRRVLATPPELLLTASSKERARVDALVEHILPVSARAAGLRSDTAAGKHLAPAELETLRLPTLIVSARDDGYGTYASAAYTAGRITGSTFIGFEQGGHTWVGHDDEVMAAVLALLLPRRDGNALGRPGASRERGAAWLCCAPHGTADIVGRARHGQKAQGTDHRGLRAGRGCVHLEPAAQGQLSHRPVSHRAGPGGAGADDERQLHGGHGNDARARHPASGVRRPGPLSGGLDGPAGRPGLRPAEPDRGRFGGGVRPPWHPHGRAAWSADGGRTAAGLAAGASALTRGQGAALPGRPHSAGWMPAAAYGSGRTRHRR